MSKNDINAKKHTLKEKIHPSVQLKKRTQKAIKKKKALRGLLTFQNRIQIKVSVKPSVCKPCPKCLYNALQRSCYFSNNFPIPIAFQKLYPLISLLIA